MELPRALRQAVDAALEGVAARDLAAASDRLSQRYRAELRDGRLHVGDGMAARAYLAARLPATYAAIRAAMDAVAAVRPDFSPRQLLDFGAGPGTALWAAHDCWPDLQAAVLIETSPAMRKFGAEFAPQSGVAAIDWREAAPASGANDLVTLAYVLDELDDPQRAALVRQLWSLTADTLLIVEPGTPAGYRRILDVRDLLLQQGAQMVAPCPHAQACPLIAPDWCHFSRRVARSRAHLQAKGAEVPWEDEKFSYLAVARNSATLPASRVIGPPRAGSGKVELKLCEQNGAAGSVLVTRRSGDRYKKVRRLSWGDAVF
ncbi:small ribosomal subunit Rsm22 family protein [Dongia sp.]|uniref:small ribosomal subunit Rsm22 family protein n=1 Tax=Dongia sp. TaxID=1977262 RepID=UPI003750E08B